MRVIPNKFAALDCSVQPTRSVQRLRRCVEGFGFHEVIIDSPDHSCCMALLPDAQVAKVLGVYKERYNALSLDRRINHVTIFKNHGVDAGASLPHPHSQLIATPVIPSQVRPACSRRHAISGGSSAGQPVLPDARSRATRIRPLRARARRSRRTG